MEISHPNVEFIWNIWPFSLFIWAPFRLVGNIFILPIYILVWWMPILWNLIFEEIQRAIWFGFAWIFIGLGQTWMNINPFFFPIYYFEWLFVYLIDWNVTSFYTLVLDFMFWGSIISFIFWLSILIIWANEGLVAPTVKTTGTETTSSTA